MKYVVRIPPPRNAAPLLIPPRVAIVKASASAAQATMMSLTSFRENMNGLELLPKGVPEDTEPSQERVVLGCAMTLRVRSPLQAWVSGSLWSAQNVPLQ